MEKFELYIIQNERNEDWFYLIIDENQNPVKVEHSWSYMQDLECKSGSIEYEVEEFLNKVPNGGRENLAIQALKNFLES